MMRLAAILFCLLLAGCGTWYPIVMADHTSNPAEGQPFNSHCDPTEDFIGGGMGHEFANRNTRLYLALGGKRIRQCGIDGRPAIDADSLGGKALVIHEFRRRHERAP